VLNKVTDHEVVLLRMRFFKDWSRWPHLSVVQLSTTGEKALHEHVVGQQQSELDLPRPQMDNRHRDALLPRPASHIKGDPRTQDELAVLALSGSLGSTSCIPPPHN